LNENTETMEIQVLVCEPDGSQRVERHTVPLDYFGNAEEVTDHGILE